MPTFKNIKLSLSRLQDYQENNFDMVIQDCTHERAYNILDGLNRNQFGNYIEYVLTRAKEMGIYVLLLPSKFNNLVCRNRFAHRYFVEFGFGFSIFIFSFAPRYDLFTKIKFKLMNPQNDKMELIKSVLTSHLHCKKILDIEPSDKSVGTILYGSAGYEYHFLTADRKLFATPIKLEI
jgi:hypothetical protein